MKHNEKIIHQNIYIELDCLLDTRIATIHTLNPDAALEVLEKGFTKRTKDNITPYTDKVKQEDFKKAYEKRTADLLVDSRPTQYFFLLKDIISGIKKQQNMRFDIGDINVFVNIYPYELSDEEKIEMQAALSEHFRADVTCISLPNYAITLEKIKAEDWVLLAIYDGRSWVERITNAMAEDKSFNPETVTRIPRVTLTFPALLRDDVEDPKKENLTTPDGQVLDVFESIRLMFVEIIAIDFLPANMFSLADPETPIKEDDEDERPKSLLDEL